MVANDARTNMLAWIGSYFDEDNIIDNNDNPVTIMYMFDGNRVPLETIFFGEDTISVIIQVCKATATPLVGHDLYIYGYNESVVLKAGVIKRKYINPDKVAHLIENELRTCLEDYPFGSYRSLNRTGEETIIVGVTRLPIYTFDFKYVRNKTS